MPSTVKIIKAISCFAIILIIIFDYLLNLTTHNNLPEWVKNQPIAHRGLHEHNVNENTLTAFQNAIDYGYPIELDVHLTSDNQVIVKHDFTLNKIIGKQVYNDQVTLADITNYYIKKQLPPPPLLTEVLDLVNGQVPIYIEIKNKYSHPTQLEPSVLELLKNYHGNIAIISFNPSSLQWFAHNAPTILRGQTSENYYNINNQNTDSDNITWWQKFMLSNFLFNWISKPHFLLYNYDDTPNYITDILSLFYQVNIFGIKSYHQAKQLKVSHNYFFDNIRPIKHIQH